MIIAVFIEKTAEVLREQRDKTRRNSVKADPCGEFNVLPSTDSVTIYNGTNDFNLKEVQYCVFVLFS